MESLKIRWVNFNTEMRTLGLKNRLEILETENMVTQRFVLSGSSVVLTQRRKELVNLKIIQ